MTRLTDLEGMIASRPLTAIGAAFALGAAVGLATAGRTEARGERTIGGMIVAGLGAVAVRLVKSYAVSMLGDAARSWLDERGAGAPSASERAASREPATEAFLEH